LSGLNSGQKQYAREREKTIMDQNVITVMHDVATRSHAGTISFPEVVNQLEQAGVERYHADLCRAERVFYMPDGESHREATGEPARGAAKEFSATDVDAAVRTIQRGEIDYQEFVRRILAAGCVNYFVYISGRQTDYYGRKGEVHVERFPAPKGT
jgi:uncharacterized protein YbcV (DUF1398 family)